MSDSEQLVFEGCGCAAAPAARRAPRSGAARRKKPERVEISSQAVDAAGLYQDIELAAGKFAVARYGVRGVYLSMQMVFPGWEWLVGFFKVCIGHSDDLSLGEEIYVAVNTARRAA